MIIPAVYKLYGPAQTPSMIVTDTASDPKFIGQVLSGSTQFFNFSDGLTPVSKARLLVLWASRNVANYVQLIKCDSGPSNIEEVARIQGNGNMSVSVQAVDVTNQLNALIAAGQNKQLGFRIGGDGVNQWALYGVQLEVDYLVS